MNSVGKSMHLTFLGVGSAMAVDHYNTCFVMSDDEGMLLVDAGGGNRIFNQLRQAGIDWQDIRELFITHHHIDHFFGAIWLIRMVGYYCQKGIYQGRFTVYGNEDVIGLLDQMCRQLLNSGEIEWIGKSINLVVVHDGESLTVFGRNTVFFDIHSPKLIQYGFVMDIDRVGDRHQSGKRIACCGDEPFHESARKYVHGCNWMLHEAYCLHDQADRYNPYDIYHSTVKDACQNAVDLEIENLILYHSEEDTEPFRQELYLKEAKRFYSGNMFVPCEMDVIEIR